ncbi:hypothetical protein [Streptomyces sp. uw30]|uniref:hypothetical protein n=1 Tax=Streptomyces sp. uw30 TaxID=1828179 RepID=UPI00165186A0|nr:hypothetical protein [Streptomyces sp. uw30]
MEATGPLFTWPGIGAVRSSCSAAAPGSGEFWTLLSGAPSTVSGVSTVTGVPKPSRARRTLSASTSTPGPFPAGTTRTSGRCDRLLCTLSRTSTSVLPGGGVPRRSARSRRACSRTSAGPWWTCCHRAFSAEVAGSGPGEYRGGSWVVYDGGSCVEYGGGFSAKSG